MSCYGSLYVIYSVLLNKTQLVLVPSSYANISYSILVLKGKKKTIYLSEPLNSPFLSLISDDESSLGGLETDAFILHEYVNLQIIYNVSSRST